MTLRQLSMVGLACALALSATAVSAQEIGRSANRGISISNTGLHSKASFGAFIDWNRHHLRKSGKNALGVTLVATTDDEGAPVLRKKVHADGERPGRHYTFPLDRSQKRLVRDAEGVGVTATQKVNRRNGLYRLALVARSGAFPGAARASARGGVSAQSRCSPLQAGGTYDECYLGYLDLSDMTLNNTSFVAAQFPYSSLPGTNLANSDLHLAQFGYANLKNANLSNADLSEAYLFGANLMGANLTGADLTDAQFCYTIMPNGTTNKADCGS